MGLLLQFTFCEHLDSGTMRNLGNTKTYKEWSCHEVTHPHLIFHLWPLSWQYRPWDYPSLPDLNNLASTLHSSVPLKRQIQSVTRIQGHCSNPPWVESCPWGDESPALLGIGEGPEAEKQGGLETVLHSSGWNHWQSQECDTGHPSICFTSWTTQAGPESS